LRTHLNGYFQARSEQYIKDEWCVAQHAVNEFDSCAERCNAHVFDGVPSLAANTDFNRSGARHIDPYAPLLQTKYTPNTPPSHP
jgi:hypothetical protein